MELVEHGVSKTGQRRRKISRHQSVQRTQKRKQLEKQEELSQIEEGADATNKIRGSKAATNERVIQGSLIFGGKTQKETEDEQDAGSLADSNTDDKEGGESFVEEDEGDDDDADGDYVGEEEDGAEDDDEEEIVEEESDTEAAPKRKNGVSPKSSTKRKKPRLSSATRPKRRRLHRMRNFRSNRMAEKHGDALGAHARGKPGIAIRKLRQVAQQAPSAPQIYSSLGMVYEDMLQTSQRQQQTAAGPQERTTQDAENGKPAGGVSFSIDAETERTTTLVLSEQLGLAKKAYGSYHAAAILCKRDYTLWLRAGDAASEIAELHTAMMKLPDLGDDLIKFHRAEKQRWLEEAKSDYETADNLNPPGIDIPAKLANVMIEIGCLSEALTLLTNLKDDPAFAISYRAWLLYADLMLRVGHECSQWNRGVQTNSNYMFRRWLRKWSESFDWRERRLQALVKALEAACGTECCTGLIQWLSQRVELTGETETSETDEEEKKQAAIGDTRKSLEGDVVTYIGFEREKELLLHRNASELAAFDKTTEDMDLEEDSVPAKERQEARSDLIQRQNSALVTLVGEFHQRDPDKSLTPRSDSKLPSRKTAEPELPVSGSIRTVCTIASELIRHMLGMHLYDGGKNVGECVSLYLKERAHLRDQRVQAAEIRKAEQTQAKSPSIFAVDQEPYDEENETGSNDDSQFHLSDDDDLDAGEEETVLSPLRKGILPPEIRLLYGLCLACEGGKAFFATQCIQIISEFPQEPSSWLTEKDVDTNVSADSRWLIFQSSMTEPLGRTAAFAFVADVLQKSGRELDLAKRLTQLYCQHAAELSENGMVSLALEGTHRNDEIFRHRQNQVVKVLVAGTRYQVESAEALFQSGDVADENASTLFDAITSLSKLLPVIWCVEQDASISSACTDAIDCMARTFRLFSRYLQHQSHGHGEVRVEGAFTNMVQLVSILSGVPLKTGDTVQLSETALDAFPLPTSWLSPDLAALSLRTLNICVATNVSLFSGWESEEFSVRLLRGATQNFFGVVMDGGLVAGYVSESMEEELTKQWGLVRDHLAPSLALNFPAKLQALRGTEWYKATRNRYHSTREQHRIVFYGEDHALSALLSFSRTCLLTAIGNKSAKTGGVEKFFVTALSILLPVSQFCLNETLWGASVGRQAAASTSAPREWQDASTLNKGKRIPAPSSRPGYERPSKRAARSFGGTLGKREVHEWFEWENKSDAMSNLIALPLAMLGRVWRGLINGVERRESSKSMASIELMSQLECGMKKLRASHTEQAAENASLRVATDLLQLAACPDCCNPFLCLQQAAVMASQAPKGGTSDRAFHAGIPKMEDCTPLEALLLLGRADCLLSVYFYQEAAFLCNYAGVVCSRHRDELDEIQKDERWRIVASLAYDLSVMIRNFSRTIIFEQAKKEDTSGTWDVTAIEEFQRARTEGLAWKATTDDDNDRQTFRHRPQYTLTRSIVQPTREEGAQASIPIVPTMEYLDVQDTLNDHDEGDDDSVFGTKLYAV